MEVRLATVDCVAVKEVSRNTPEAQATARAEFQFR
jgi:hypothetical protein